MRQQWSYRCFVQSHRYCGLAAKGDNWVPYQHTITYTLFSIVPAVCSARFLYIASHCCWFELWLNPYNCADNNQRQMRRQLGYVWFCDHIIYRHGTFITMQTQVDCFWLCNLDNCRILDVLISWRHAIWAPITNNNVFNVYTIAMVLWCYFSCRTKWFKMFSLGQIHEVAIGDRRLAKILRCDDSKRFYNVILEIFSR